MNKDQRKELLHHAAENEDALFVNGESTFKNGIAFVMCNPQLDWRIYDKWEAEKLAFAEGKVIQLLNENNQWVSISNPTWKCFEYRIKPATTELRYQWVTVDGKCSTNRFYATYAKVVADAHNLFTVRLDYTAMSFEVEVV